MARTDAQSGVGWGAVALVVAAGIVTAFQAGKAAIATPWLLADMGLDLSAAGWLTGIFALLGILGGIPTGALVARIGDRPVLLVERMGGDVRAGAGGSRAAAASTAAASPALAHHRSRQSPYCGPTPMARASPAGMKQLHRPKANSRRAGSTARSRMAGPATVMKRKPRPSRMRAASSTV